MVYKDLWRYRDRHHLSTRAKENRIIKEQMAAFKHHNSPLRPYNIPARPRSRRRPTPPPEGDLDKNLLRTGTIIPMIMIGNQATQTTNNQTGFGGNEVIPQQTRQLSGRKNDPFYKFCVDNLHMKKEKIPTENDVRMVRLLGKLLLPPDVRKRRKVAKKLEEQPKPKKKPPVKQKSGEESLTLKPRKSFCHIGGKLFAAMNAIVLPEEKQAALKIEDNGKEEGDRDPSHKFSERRATVAKSRPLSGDRLTVSKTRPLGDETGSRTRKLTRCKAGTSSKIICYSRSCLGSSGKNLNSSGGNEILQ